MNTRIISGLFKNRTLSSVQSNKVRPTTSKVREAIFNILNDSIENAFFLDLFAGCGSVGFEALSRGAAFVVFVEKDKKNALCIKKNQKTLKVEEQSLILFQDAFSAVKNISKKMQFSFVYIDPPYAYYDDENFLRKLLSDFLKNRLLKEGALLIVETPKEINFEDSFDRFSLIDCKKYGNTKLFFFRFKKLC